MSEFDRESERCLNCDGHFRHFPGCAFYTGEPVLSLEERVAVRAQIAIVEHARLARLSSRNRAGHRPERTAR